MNTRTIRLLVIIAVPLVLFFISSTYVFEWMWMNELGYSEIFWTVRGAQVLLTLSAFLIAATYLVFNLRYLADRLRSVSFAGTPLQNLNINLALESHHKQMKLLFTIIALFIAFIFSVGFYISWDDSLRFVWNVPFGED
jgi:uncharacterized protein